MNKETETETETEKDAQLLKEIKTITAAVATSIIIAFLLMTWIVNGNPFSIIENAFPRLITAIACMFAGITAFVITAEAIVKR